MELKWITLRVQNMVLAKAFYEEYLGLPCVRMFSPAPDMQIAFFKAENGMEIELIESVKIPVHCVNLQWRPGSLIGSGRELERHPETSWSVRVLRPGKPEWRLGFIKRLIWQDLH